MLLLRSNNSNKTNPRVDGTQSLRQTGNITYFDTFVIFVINAMAILAVKGRVMTILQVAWMMVHLSISHGLQMRFDFLDHGVSFGFFHHSKSHQIFKIANARVE